MILDFILGNKKGHFFSISCRCRKFSESCDGKEGRKMASNLLVEGFRLNGRVPSYLVEPPILRFLLELYV